MSSAGRAASSSGCVARPRGREIGLIGFAAQIRRSSLIGSYVMETAEHREPCESRGSRTVLGARGGEIPPRDSTLASIGHWARVRLSPDFGHVGLLSHSSRGITIMTMAGLKRAHELARSA